MIKKRKMTWGLVLGMALMLLTPAGGRAEELFDSKAAGIHLQRGLTFYYQDRFQNAIREFEAAAMINPDDVRASYYLGYTYYRLRDMRKAQEAFDQAYQVSPDYSPFPEPSAK